MFISYLLFILSILLVGSSSYFITSLIRDDHKGNYLLYFILITSSNLIITFEILSLFKQIHIPGVLIINAVIFLASFIVWKARKSPVLSFENIPNLIEKIKNALKKDKILLVLAIFFAFSATVGLLIVIFTPVNNHDAMVYHLTRPFIWIQNQSLEHFDTSCILQLIFPLNSELFILWPILFTKQEFWAQLAQYASYWGLLVILFNFLSTFKISTRRKMWAVLILASLPTLILKSVSGHNDLVFAFYIFAAMYLFIYSQKNNSLPALIFSAVSLAITAGIKSSLFMALPALCIVYLFALFFYNRHKFLKTTLLYFFIGLISFALLSSYNYILNYLDFNNIIALQSYTFGTVNHDLLDFRFFLANFIRYILVFFDFSGMRFLDHILNDQILIPIKDFLFYLFHLKDSDGFLEVVSYIDPRTLFRSSTTNYEPFALMGPIGAYLLILGTFSFFSKIKGTFSTRNKMIAITGISFLSFILILSLLIGYTMSAPRHAITAGILASPVLIYSYNRNFSITKILIASIAVFYFVNSTLFNNLKPVFPVNGLSVLKDPAYKLRYEPLLNNGYMYPLMDWMKKNIPDNSKIVVLFNAIGWYSPFYTENPSWKIYIKKFDDLIKEKDLEKYDYVIVSTQAQGVYNRKKINDIKDTFTIIYIDFRFLMNNFQLEKGLVTDRKSNLPDKPVYNYEYYIFKRKNKD